MRASQLLCTDDVILYLANPEKSFHSFYICWIDLGPFKVNVTKSSANSKESFEYLERTCPFHISKKGFKYSDINLPPKPSSLYKANYVSTLKQICNDLDK